MYKVELISMSPEVEVFDSFEELLAYLNNVDFRVSQGESFYDLIITTIRPD